MTGVDALPTTAGRHVDPALRLALQEVQESVPLVQGGGASLTKALVLADLIIDYDLSTFVELGVFRGRLLLPIGRLFAGLGRGRAIGIDPYDADAAVQHDEHNRGFDLRAWVYAQDWDSLHTGVTGAIARWGIGDHTEIIRERSFDVADRFKPGSIDLLHIDGNHDAAAVAQDLEAYLPRVRPGGFVVLDDASWPSVAPHALRLAARHQLAFSLFDGAATLDSVRGNDFAVIQITDSADDARPKLVPNRLERLSRPWRARLSKAPLCEIHTAISPDLGFATRVHYLAATLRRNGGALADCPLIVTVGGEEHIDMAGEYPWSGPLGIEWRYLDDETYRRRGLYGTAAIRFTYEFASPAVLILDADTVFCAPIDDAIADVLRRPSLTGVIAHLSPFIGRPGEQAIWGEIFAAAGLGRPPMLCEHNGWEILENEPARRLCPPYYNLGFVLAPRAVMSAVGASILHEMDIVDAVFPTLFRCQLGLTMALLRAEMPWGALPMRFNLPNIRDYIPRHQAELDDARVIHYLREEEVTRAENFASPDTVGEWIARDHRHPINARLAATLHEVHDEVLTRS